MNIGFYIDEMNYRGVANSSYHFSYYNQKILKNKSIIFYNEQNVNNIKEVIKKFRKSFKVIGIKRFEDIDSYKYRFNLDFIYVQKGGEKNTWSSLNIKTLVHCVYPQRLREVHGHKYVYISEWLSDVFSRKKIPFVPLIIQVAKTNENLKKKLRIKKDQIVFGCHGGKSSFDLKFAQDTIKNLIKEKKNLTFIFLNINKFCSHPRVIFLKGTSNEVYKKKFLNSCDAMIYGRSLGESFGISCGEFSILGKKIISYKFNRHRSHIANISKKNLKLYGSRKELSNILRNFKKEKNKNNIKSKYFDYTPRKVMNKFKQNFLTKKENIKFSLSDYFFNFLSFYVVYYLYLRHKIYNHYYNYFESNFFKNK